MRKPKKKITIWAQYDKALLIEEHSSSDVSIETAQVVKGVFAMSLRAFRGFTNAIFQLMDAPQVSSRWSNENKYLYL
ncbi:MAG: transposase [Shewanella sp.]|nr:transposase [Shewanella sp.]